MAGTRQTDLSDYWHDCVNEKNGRNRVRVSVDLELDVSGKEGVENGHQKTHSQRSFSQRDLISHEPIALQCTIER